MTPVVRTNQLVRYYPAVRADPVKAVDSVDWELDAGRLALISGPSGSGKTTLLALIAGLDRPNHGTVELFGQDLGTLSDAATALLRRERIGLVFQDFKLLPQLPCWQNVALPLVPAGLNTAERRGRAMRWLQEFGISDAAERPPEQLSGGQQQRVALARAMVTDPELILADEPTSQIDEASAERVLGALNDLVKAGKTVVVTTHDSRLATGDAIRFRMAAGQLEAMQ